MAHETYTGKIKCYVDGIEHDLSNVTANEGHVLVKDSIMEQARRLADIATHNNEFLVMMMDEFLTVMEDYHDIVHIGEYDTWERISHEQLMKEFNVYLRWGLDAIDHFDDEENHAVQEADRA